MILKKKLGNSVKFAADSSAKEKADPFSFFDVKKKNPLNFYVFVHEGRKISKGMISDFIDTPDPYISVTVPFAAKTTKKTRYFTNQKSPKFNEELLFKIPPFEDLEDNEEIEIAIMDKNYSSDDLNSRIFVELSDLVVTKEYQKRTFYFSESSEVDISFKFEEIHTPDLRYSLALCGSEKYFRSKRKERVKLKLQELLSQRGPKSVRHTPTIALLGSGGGFRAMVGMAGAMNALQSSGILDTVTYAAGLSGSGWYISTFYNSSSLNSKSVNEEIKGRIENSKMKFLAPEKLRGYVKTLWEKHKIGQPVSFTDIFGTMIGESLLGKHNLKARLSDMTRHCHAGENPLPIMVAVVVKPKESAIKYHEWVEFTPFEIGVPKYGTFMKPENFGSEFFMGSIVQKFEEFPLHFLQGLWGSAFSILIHRVVDPKSPAMKESETEEMNQIIQEENGGTNSDEDMPRRRSTVKQNNKGVFKKSINSIWSAGKSVSKWFSSSSISNASEIHTPEPAKSSSRLELPEKRPSRRMSRNPSGSPRIEGERRRSSHKRRPSMSVLNIDEPKYCQNENNNCLTIGREKSVCRSPSICDDGSLSFFNRFCLIVNDRCSFLSNRGIRAPRVLNFMRGLDIEKNYPLSPFTSDIPIVQEEGEFQLLDEPIPDRKVLHIVDGGLAMNLPFPPVLRPQRAVDIFIAFEFSARSLDDPVGENFDPLQQVRLAEKWARIHDIPFPHVPVIDPNEPLEEVYLIKDELNMNAPIIILFMLVNNSFKDFSKPGIKREEGDKSGDFPIFENQSNMYSTFNFTYDKKSFENLESLMEYNVLNNIELVKDVISDVVKLRRRFRTRHTISRKDIEGSSMREREKDELLNTIFAKDDLVNI